MGAALTWRGMVAWRVVLAVAANYAVVGLLAAVLAIGLPRLGVSRAEATVWGTLAAIFAAPVVPIFIFAARGTWRVTAVMAAAAALLALVLWLAGGAG